MNLDVISPLVAIGGLGGSGTRVVAQILRDCGVYLGADLNLENDNLWFTLLFKRPRWAAEASAAAVRQAISLFEQAMTGQLQLTPEHSQFLLQATAEMAKHGHNHQGDGRGLWAFERLQTLLASADSPPSGQWGWKEPNTHLFLEEFWAARPQLKFVQVLRHGLDIAFSKNQQQLYNWGAHFGVPAPATPADEPAAALKYWVRANQRVVTLSVNHAIPHRLLLLNFSRLCTQPEREIRALLDFLELDVSPEHFAALCQLPQVQPSQERYRREDCSRFDPADIEAVRAFGFEVEF